jgi:hypothetical protein
LVIDSGANIAEGFYSTNGTTYTSTGASYTVPRINITGMGVTNSTAYAGIFSTYRNGTTAVNYKFDDFKISKIVEGSQDTAGSIEVKTIKVNFQDKATIPPTGYIRDYGQPYAQRTGLYQSTGLTYGWKRKSDNTALNLTAKRAQ